jgi:hypothetical protein
LPSHRLTDAHHRVHVPAGEEPVCHASTPAYALPDPSRKGANLDMHCLDRSS